MISDETFADPASLSILSYESNFVACTVGLLFCKMPLKYNIHMHLVLHWNRFLKFIVLSPCKPGAVEKVTKSFCQSLEMIRLSLTDDNSSTRRQKNEWKFCLEDLILQVIPLVRKNRGGWGQFFQIFDKGHLLGWCWLNHRFCFRASSALAWALGSSNNLLPCAAGLISFLLMSSAALYCVCFSARCACTNQSLRLHMFLEIMPRN